jgi:putative transcriptional regulator
MKKRQNGTISVVHEPDDAYRDTGTDWDAVDALSDEQIHAASLSDPNCAPIPVHETPGLIHQVNVKRLRERLGLTQEAFAVTYRIPIGTLRDWEQRRKNPDATARAYITVIARNPKAVAELLRQAA